MRKERGKIDSSGEEGGLNGHFPLPSSPPRGAMLLEVGRHPSVHWHAALHVLVFARVRKIPCSSVSGFSSLMSWMNELKEMHCCMFQCILVLTARVVSTCLSQCQDNGDSVKVTGSKRSKTEISILKDNYWGEATQSR
jgi:hypothetical protein